MPTAIDDKKQSESPPSAAPQAKHTYKSHKKKFVIFCCFLLEYELAGCLAGQHRPHAPTTLLLLVIAHFAQILVIFSTSVELRTDGLLWLLIGFISVYDSPIIAFYYFCCLLLSSCFVSLFVLQLQYSL